MELRSTDRKLSCRQAVNATHAQLLVVMINNMANVPVQIPLDSMVLLELQLYGIDELIEVTAASEYIPDIIKHLNARVTDQDSVKLETQIRDMKNGKYMVQFVPLREGKLNIDITLYGQHITHSPFPVTVKEVESDTEDVVEDDDVIFLKESTKQGMLTKGNEACLVKVSDVTCSIDPTIVYKAYIGDNVEGEVAEVVEDEIAEVVEGEVAEVVEGEVAEVVEGEVAEVVEGEVTDVVEGEVAEVVEGEVAEVVEALAMTHSNHWVTILLRLIVICGPDVKVTGTVAEVVEGEVAEAVEGKVAEVFEGEVAEVVVGEVAEVDEGEVTDVVEGEAAEVDEGEVADIVEGEVTEVVEGEVADIVEGEVADIVEGEVTEAVESGVTESVEGEVADIVEGEVTEAVESELTEAVEGEVEYSGCLILALDSPGFFNRKFNTQLFNFSFAFVPPKSVKKRIDIHFLSSSGNDSFQSLGSTILLRLVVIWGPDVKVAGAVVEFVEGEVAEAVEDEVGEVAEVVEGEVAEVVEVFKTGFL
ncbi:unnamed protein product [Owenia fusiformis]|uniref:Uncharacterized protein n=1 Tax=Owenia fusiformis TaxID=6347 RepID=A0A8S4N7V4_OWEFU|nr:unnamed protein product [Owenia fusiformis]